MSAILNMAFLTAILGYIAQGTQILGFRSNNLWGIAYNIAFVIAAINVHLWFNAIERGCITLLFMFSFVFWHHAKWRYRFALWHLVPFAALFAIMYWKLHASDASPLLDAFTATVGLIGTLLASMRNKYAFVLFLLCNGFEALMFFKLGGTSINLAIMETVFCLSNIPAFIIWTKRRVHR